ncbi:unnamed protein product [Cyclocybe aegerita]|uniref:Uncharacterized protein n=1 Tax=Cyclocybe aegerita TaxID=1973307 RepID=A0A8S0WMV4_CYCAE|nr:unnamed protein product [Cyclocybe aegerita]
MSADTLQTSLATALMTSAQLDVIDSLTFPRLSFCWVLSVHPDLRPARNTLAHPIPPIRRRPLPRMSLGYGSRFRERASADRGAWRLDVFCYCKAAGSDATERWAPGMAWKTAANWVTGGGRARPSCVDDDWTDS